MSNGSGGFLTALVLLFAGYVIVMWIAAAIILAATAAYYITLFISFALSALCLLTLKHRVYIGRLSLGPEQSQPFIARGVIGTLLLPAFGLFCEHYLNRHVPDWAWPHLFAVGWSLGSVGIGLLEDDLATFSHGYDHPVGLVLEHEARPALPSGPSLLQQESIANSGAVAVREDRPASAPTPPAPRQAPSGPPCPAVAKFQFATWDDEEEMRARAARKAALREKKKTDPTVH